MEEWGLADQIRLSRRLWQDDFAKEYEWLNECHKYVDLLWQEDDFAKETYRIIEGMNNWMNVITGIRNCVAKDETLNEKEQNDSRMKHGRKERKNERHNGKMKLRDRRALPEVAAGVSLVISVSGDADEEEWYERRGKRRQAWWKWEEWIWRYQGSCYFLNPFGTLRIECIYSFALHHENLQRGKWHSHCMLWSDIKNKIQSAMNQGHSWKRMAVKSMR